MIFTQPKSKIFLGVLASFLVCLTLLDPAISQAAFNPQISYQAKLTDHNDVAVTAGDYNIEFKLYDSAETVVWTETRTGANKVAVSSGMFSVLLGEVTPINDVDFNQTLSLGVNIGGTTTVPVWDGEMSPRKTIGAVPAAFTAEKFDGLATTSFLRSDVADTMQANTASALFTINQTGAGDIFDVKQNGTSVFSVFNNGTASTSNLKVSGTSELGTITQGVWQGSVIADDKIADNITASNYLSLVDWFATTSAPQLSTLTGLTTVGSVGATTTVLGGFSAHSVLYVDSATDNVGIGTANPEAKLDVSGTIQATNLVIPSGGSITLGGMARSTWPSGGGASGYWATSSDSLVGYPSLSGNYAIVIGAGATSSPNLKFEVVGNSKLGGALTVTGNITSANLSGTNTGDNTFGDGLTLTAGDVDCDTASGVVFGCLSSADWTTFNSKQNAITTGTTLQYLRGDLSLATLDTSAVPENGSLYWTNDRFDTRLFATTSLPNLATLAGLSTIGSSTGQTTILGRAMMTNASTTNLSASGWLVVSGKTTLANASTTEVTVTNKLTAGSAKIGSLAGLLFGTAGEISAVSTSSLNINTDNLVQGSTNLFWSNALFDTRLFATTSLPNLATLAGLSTIGSSTGQTTILGKTVMTNASTTNLSASGWLAVNGDLTAANIVATGTLTTSGTTTVSQLCFASGVCMSTTPITGTNITMYHWNGGSDVASYEMFRTYPDATTQVDESCSATSGYCAAPIDSYVSTTTDLAIDSIPAGTWEFNYFAYVSATAGVSKIEATVYKRSALGVETALFTATSSEINSTTVTETQFMSTQPAFAFSLTDRLVVKVRGWTDSGSAKVIHFVYGGAVNYSHIHTPIHIANFGYAVKSSNETIAGNWTFSSTTIFSNNVGLGTTTPSNRLEVSGNTFLGGNLTATGTLAVLGTATFQNGNIVFDNPTASSSRILVGATVPDNDASSTGMVEVKGYYPGGNRTGGIYAGQLNSVIGFHVGMPNATQQTSLNLWSYGGGIHLRDAGVAGLPEYLTILSSSGKVGIGTTTPSAKLAVHSTSGDNTPLFVVASSTAGTGTSTAFYIGANGNVGIGTTSPSAKLDVWGNLQVGTSSTPALFVNTATGRVGIGTTTPEVYLDNPAHNINNNNAQFGTFGIQSYGDTNGFMGSNGYYDDAASSWRLRKTGASSLFQFNAGSIALRTVASGAGGALAAIDTRLMVRLTGDLVVGNANTSGVSTAPSAGIFQAVGGSGTNIAGANLIIGGGKSTGSATPASILFQTSDVGTSGSTLQTLSTKMTLLGNGNVGIGTTTPSNRLEVSGHTFLGGNLTATGTLAVQGTGTSTIAGDLAIDTSVLYVDSVNNRVGIGTSTPQKPLEVMEVDGADSIGLRLINPTGNVHYGGLDFYSSQPKYSTARITSTHGGSYNNAALRIAVADSSHNLQDRLVINTTGNVGIGTTTPSNRLEVSGNTFLGGNLTATGTLTVLGNSSLQNASTTNLSASGWLAVGGALTVTGNITGANLSGTNTGDNTFGDGLTLTGSDVDCDTASASVFGCLSSANWTTFNNKWDGLNDITLAQGNVFVGNASGNPVATSTLYLKDEKVGIGTTSPASKLDVWNNFSATDDGQVINARFNWDDDLSSGTGTQRAILGQGIFATGTISGGGAAIFGVYGEAVSYRNNGVGEGGMVTLRGGNFPSYGDLGTVGQTDHFGVKGGANGTADLNVGVSGEAADATANVGIYGTIHGTSTRSQPTSGNWAGYFDGALYVNATSTFTGNIGIGTTTPQFALSIVGGSSATVGNVPSPPTGSAVNDVDGTYVGGGMGGPTYNNKIKVYAYKDDGGRVYSAVGAESAAVDDLVDQYYRISWSWTAVAGADGYRILKSNATDGDAVPTANYDYYADVATNSYIDGDTYPTYGNSANPFIGPASVTVTPSSGSGGGPASVQITNGGLCVDNDGWCNASTTGTISARVYHTGASDLAENYHSSETLEAGDIVSPAGGESVTKADNASGLPVLGIVSSNPGMVLGLDNDETRTDRYPVALSGRVPVKVSTENGGINVGDYIALSTTTPGVGVKATLSGQTVGIALESFSDSSNRRGRTETGIRTGKILVFVTLGYAKLSSGVAGGEIEFTGTSFDLGNFDLDNVRAIRGASGSWSIGEDGTIVAKEVKTDKLCLGGTCVTEEEFKTLLQTANVSAVAPSTGSNPSSTPVLTPEITPTETPAPTESSGSGTTPTPEPTPEVTPESAPTETPAPTEVPPEPSQPPAEPPPSEPPVTE